MENGEENIVELLANKATTVPTNFIVELPKEIQPQESAKSKTTNTTKPDLQKSYFLPISPLSSYWISID